MLQPKKPKPIVAIFAHPDDEAFGPSGTLIKMAQKSDVYLLCATKGEIGKGPKKNLPEIREKELKSSAKIIGIKKVHFLGFKDGQLCNSSYHKLAEKIAKHLNQIKPEILITFEPRGVSGHIDHITVSMVVSFLFERLGYVKKIMYYCIDQFERKHIGKYFIYFPPGYSHKEIDEQIDINNVWETKKAAMLAHKSQNHDAKTILKILEKLPKKEYFLTKTK